MREGWGERERGEERDRGRGRGREREAHLYTTNNVIEIVSRMQ